MLEEPAVRTSKIRWPWEGTMRCWASQTMHAHHRTTEHQRLHRLSAVNSSCFSHYLFVLQYPVYISREREVNETSRPAVQWECNLKSACRGVPLVDHGVSWATPWLTMVSAGSYPRLHLTLHHRHLLDTRTLRHYLLFLFSLCFCFPFLFSPIEFIEGIQRNMESRRRKENRTSRPAAQWQCYTPVPHFNATLQCYAECCAQCGAQCYAD